MDSAGHSHQIASLVEAAIVYKLIIGREPRAPDELLSIISKEYTLQELRDILFTCPEFSAAAQHYAPNHKPLDGSPVNIEIHASAGCLDQMMTRIEHIFRKAGETEPYLAMLANEKFRSATIEQHKKEFFGTGIDNVRTLQAFADRSGLDLSAFRVCFELGCGVGRITTWLAEIFPAVIAGDISMPILQIARNSLEELERKNIEYVSLNKIEKFDQLPAFDVFFSSITFQHNPPPLSYAMLSRILEKLRPGGIALFQLPTYATGYNFAAEDYLQSPSPGAGIELHVLPQRAVFDILEQHDCRMLELREDGSCGPSLAIISNTFFVQKRERK